MGDFENNQQQELSELRERVSFLESLLNNVPHDLVVFNEKHEYLFINEKAIRDPEIRNWMLNKTDFDYCEKRGLPAELAQSRRAIFDQAVQNNKAIVFEEHKSEEIISRNMIPVFLNDSLKYVLGYAFNVTHLHELNKQLKIDIEREQLRVKFRKLIVESPDVESLCRDFSEEIRISFNANCSLLRLYASEFDQEKHYGFSNSIIDESENARQLQELTQLLDQMKNAPGSESKSYCPLSHENFNGTAFAIRSGGNSMEGCLLIGNWEMDTTDWHNEFFQEISQLLAMRIVELRSYQKIRQMNEDLNKAVDQRTMELRQINRGLEMFVGAASHDLKAPLRQMMSYLKLIDRQLKDSANQDLREYLDFVSKSSSDLFNLVNALLQFSRVGNNILQKKQIVLNEMLLDILRSMGLSTDDEQRSIEIRAEGEMWGDPILLRQVLINLISNAVKFSGKKDKAIIELSAGPSGDRYQIMVKDNGVGFDSKAAADLFQPFRRFHEARDFDGNGMGLAIVHSIVKRHSGEIHCSSEPGVGTCFTLTFPLSEETASEKKSSADAKALVS